MPPTLEKYFTLRAYFDRPNILQVGAVKGGPQRLIVPLSPGFLKGENISAELLPGSGDWFLLNTETSTGHIDVRLNLRTEKGAAIHVHYDGLMKVDELAEAAVLGSEKAKSTRYGDHELFATPIMETSDPEWKWIESSVWVAEGRFEVERKEGGLVVAIEYEVYKVNKSQV